jgi:trk system potassium uptake protein TrkH
MNYRSILRVLGFMSVADGVAMLPSAALAFADRGAELGAILLSSAIPIAIGVAVLIRTRGEVSLRVREGFAIATFGWGWAAIFGALPFYLSGACASPADAFFESMSGFTTTGATIFADVESLPRSILLWRSLTQWMGGMGIVALSVAVLPLSGGGGMQLLKAEVPGPTADRLSPRIQSTAKILWGLYAGLTAAETALLAAKGMSLFDALCHSLCTVSTGGFSTRNASVAAFDSAWVDAVVIAFMFLAAINFSLHFGLIQRRSWGVYLENEELRLYAAITALAASLLWLNLDRMGTVPHLGLELRQAVFQTVSILTSTGFGTADYVAWGFGAQVLLFSLMVIGGCAGSTGGGMKVVRALVLAKHIVRLVKQQLQPRAVYTVKNSGKPLSNEVMMYILGFVPFYLLLTVAVALVIWALGVEASAAFGASIASLSNIGPGFGEVGPAGNYSGLRVAAKLLLPVVMLMGRLELFTVMAVFSPMFWRRT